MEDLIYIPTKRFVYFDNLGNLLSISNTKNADGNFIEVDDFAVKDLVSGKEHLHQYCINFDTVIKTYVLEYRNTEVINANHQLHYIDRKDVLSADLTIIQHVSRKEWVIMLSDPVRNNFSGKNISIDASLMFSITRYNDVQSLERVINIELIELISNDCVKIPFNSQIESDTTALSVYTIKRLDSYRHEVINE